MKLYRLIKKPIVTEKTSNLELTNSTYVFTVDKRATKIDVKKAIFELSVMMRNVGKKNLE